MAIPNFQKFFLPVLRIAQDGETSLTNAINCIADEFKLTEKERELRVPSNTQTIINNRVSWARTYLIKAGLLKSTRRGYFTITDAGKEVLSTETSDIDINFLKKYPSFKLFQSNYKNDNEAAEQENDGKELTPEETIHNSIKEIEESLGDEILNKIMSQNPTFFENLIVKLLVAMGYGGSVEEAGKALGKSGDGGVDGVIYQDVLGLDSIYVQAKRYSEGNNVSPGSIRDFFGSLDKVKASKGLFVTTSDFTNEAKETAQFLSKRLVLINGKQLVKLMIRYNIGCRVEETLYIKKLNEDFFE